MKTKAVLIGASIISGAVAWSQLRITSLSPQGELTWTNSAKAGAYNLERADSPTGRWARINQPTNLNPILLLTNQVTVQVSTSNASAFYRAAWILPQPIGVWDYQGYDKAGTLVITGRLDMTATSVPTSNSPANPIQQVIGSWNLQYAGPSTNTLWYLGPQVGSGSFSGTLEIGTATLQLRWPTNYIDNNMAVNGKLWPDHFIGTWGYSGIVPLGTGTFIARKR